jgi:hypothetical protein
MLLIMLLWSAHIRASPLIRSLYFLYRKLSLIAIAVENSGSQTGCRELRQSVSPNNPVISFFWKAHIFVT